MWINDKELLYYFKLVNELVKTYKISCSQEQDMVKIFSSRSFKGKTLSDMKVFF